jgi:hypothetical protein
MYGENYHQSNDDDELGVTLPLPDDLRELYPNLVLALSGRCGSKKQKTPPLPPATLILFARDGGIGFVIAPKEAPKNAHGFVSDPGPLLTQIEAEIAEGRIGWKPHAKKRY